MRGQLIEPAEILGYLLAAYLVMKRLRGAGRDMVFAVLNIVALYLFFFYGRGNRSALTFLAYLSLAIVQYLTLRLFVKKSGWRPWLAIFTPILALVLIRYVPPSLYEGSHFLNPGLFIGISYLAFRTSHLVLEIRNGAVPIPTFCRSLGFCFFVPTMPVGPINPYSNYGRAFEVAPPFIPARRAWL